mgnify:CR=1 FL=1
MSKIDCGYYRDGKCNRRGDDGIDIDIIERENKRICVYNTQSKESDKICYFATAVYTGEDYLKIVKEELDIILNYFKSYEYRKIHNKNKEHYNLCWRYRIYGPMSEFVGDRCTCAFNSCMVALLLKHNFELLGTSEIITSYHLAKALNIKLDKRIINRYKNTIRKAKRYELELCEYSFEKLELGVLTL